MSLWSGPYLYRPSRHEPLGRAMTISRHEPLGRRVRETPFPLLGVSASPTACPSRGYGRGEAVILSTGTPIPAQRTCRRRCRDRAEIEPYELFPRSRHREPAEKFQRYSRVWSFFSFFFWPLTSTPCQEADGTDDQSDLGRAHAPVFFIGARRRRNAERRDGRHEGLHRGRSRRDVFWRHPPDRRKKASRGRFAVGALPRRSKKKQQHRSGAPSGEGPTTVAAVAYPGPDPGADAHAAVDGAAEPSGPAMADEAASGYNLVEDVDAVFERIRGRVADFERESGRQVVVMALYSYGRFRESGRQVPARLNKLI